MLESTRIYHVSTYTFYKKYQMDICIDYGYFLEKLTYNRFFF